MSESEYKKLILAVYERKLATNDLTSELLSPTPARIKAESIRVCEQRFKRGDEKILRSFFNEKDDKLAYLNAIKNCNAEIFKPVITFFTEKKLTSNLKNAEYLAWLLDFPGRPYHPDLKMPEETIRQQIVASDIKEADDPKPPKTKKQNPLVLLVIGLTLIIGVAFYLFIKQQSKQYTSTAGCMIWNDDHYDPAECSDHSSGKPLYPINKELIDHFKKVIDPKTLILASVGKAWYAKYNGNVEFFTDSGPYPLDTNRRVLPVTVHVLEKYVYHTTN